MKDSRIRGVKDPSEMLKKYKELEEIGDVDRILKAMIKALENKHLNPGPLGPFLTINWEKNQKLWRV